MKLSRKLAVAIIGAVMALSMSLIVSAESKVTFEGYNEHDIQKLIAFARQQQEGLLNWLEEPDPANWICTEWIEKDGVTYLKKFDMVNYTHEVTGDVDLSDCEYLDDFRVNCCNIKSVNLSGCERLTSFIFCEFPEDCGIKTHGSLESVNLTGCTNLTYLNMYYEKISELDISDCKKLEKLDLNRINITDLNLLKHKNIRELTLGVNDKLTALNVEDCEKLTLISLISNERLADVDISNCASLVQFYHTGADDADGGIINLSGLDSLDDIYLSVEGRISELNISDCKTLRGFSSYDGHIDSLNISQCDELTSIYFSNNRLKNLDVWECKNLSAISVENNELMELDLSRLPELSQLICSENDLARIELTGCTKLTKLYFSENRIREIDLSSFPELYELDCAYNPISKLDITKNPTLWWLDCTDTNIQSADDIKGYRKDIYTYGIDRDERED